MAGRLGILAQAVIVSLVIVGVRLSFAPAWFDVDAVVVVTCVLVAVIVYLVGFNATIRVLERLFGPAGR